MNDNRNKLRSLLELVKEQVETIANQKGEVPQLYIDLAKENLIKLYEEIHLIEKHKNIQHTDELTFPKIEETPTETKKEESKIAAPTNEEVSPKVEEVPEAETVEAEIAPQVEELEPKADLQKLKQLEVEKEKTKKVLESNDLFESHLSIGEKLQSQQEPALVDKFQEKQITDIKAAIGVNDKFLFINELFAGNMKRYNESIEKINGSTNKDQAIAVIEQLNQEFNWDEESEARKKLLLFIDRRY